AVPLNLYAWDWVPSEQKIQKYRNSWNPFSHGPVLQSAVDIQPEGQLHVRPFIFTQIGTRSFGNTLDGFWNAEPGPVHLYSAQVPFIQTAYGLTDHIELGAATSLQWFSATQNGQTTTETGLGDFSLLMKYRPIVQDPDTWQPSFTLFSQLVLPTSKWAGTDKPPGGFAPIGRLPSTRFGEIAFTEGLTFRKNLQPFRFSAGVYYTYAAPGSQGNQTTYTGDVINTRFVFEHILDDKRGLGYNIELVTLNGLTWRLDGHSINAGQKSGFDTIGVEPAIQWRFGSSNFVGAAGCLFTIAGRNSIDAIYPNFSIFWYWSKTGKVIMR
ncbi:MAG: hypothetical protein ACRD88_19810, partial [Terriglobia bacterium]